MPANPIPVRRVPLLCGPTGGAPVTAAYPAAMSAQALRGRGAAGTRGICLIPRGGGFVFARALAPRMAGFPYADDEAEFGSNLGGMRAGSTRLGALGVDCNADKKRVFDYHGEAGIKKLCADGYVGKAGCDTNFAAWCASWGFPHGVPMAPDAEGALLKTATSALKTFKSQLEAGTIDPASAEPTGSMNLPQPTNAANNGYYAEYSAMRDSIAGARLTGQMMWSLLHPPASSTTTTTPAGTTQTTAPAPTGTTTVGVPAGVAPSPVGYAPAGYSIYGGEDDGGIASATGGAPRAGTSIVSVGPKANSAPASTALPAGAPAAKKASLAVGGIVVAVTAIFLFAHRKKKKHAVA